MNPRLFRESILFIFSWSSWATDKPNTNFPILISRAFTWAYQIFNHPQHLIFGYFFDLLGKIFAFEFCFFFFASSIEYHKETFHYFFQKRPQEHGFILVHFQQKTHCSWLERFWELKKNFKVKMKYLYVILIQNIEIFHFGFNFIELLPSSILVENWLEWIHALVAIFGTNVETSLYGSKQVPKWRYLMEKNF